MRLPRPVRTRVKVGSAFCRLFQGMAEEAVNVKAYLNILFSPPQTNSKVLDLLRT